MGKFKKVYDTRAGQGGTGSTIILANKYNKVIDDMVFEKELEKME